MKNRRLFVTALIAVIAFVMAACSSAPSAAPTDPLVFDNAELVAVQARNADFGNANDAPGGGSAFYFSNAKTTLESGTYEIIISRQRSLDARHYQYLEFDITADNLDLLDDVIGFFPRLRTGETYVQFNGSAPMNAAISSITGESEWVTVVIPMSDASGMVLHELGENYRMVLPRIESIMLRFILNDMEPVPGRIYLRNFVFK